MTVEELYGKVLDGHASSPLSALAPSRHLRALILIPSRVRLTRQPVRDKMRTFILPHRRSYKMGGAGGAPAHQPEEIHTRL